MHMNYRKKTKVICSSKNLETLVVSMFLWVSIWQVPSAQFDKRTIYKSSREPTSDCCKQMLPPSDLVEQGEEVVMETGKRKLWPHETATGPELGPGVQ